MKTLRVALGQLDFVVGAVSANADKLVRAAESALTQGAQLIVFPELTLVGYPPEDLLWRPGLRKKVEQSLAKLTESLPADIHVIIGHPYWQNGLLFNAASVFYQGQIQARYFKQLLPNYAVFDEMRYFAQGDQACVFKVQDIPVGLTICEDIWEPGPTRLAADAGAQLIVNMNASPFNMGKLQQREQAVAERCKETGLAVVYVNLVGGQDELVYDGSSFVMDRGGRTVFRSESFEECVQCCDFDVSPAGVTPRVQSALPDLPRIEAGVYSALVLGVRDYVHKNGFKGAVIGLSGGIDSALTLKIAVDALGAENVEAVMLPSRYTSDISLHDAQQLAENLGVEYRIIGIETAFGAFLETLEGEFKGTQPDVTEENIQARCRGVILMAISNKRGKMVLTTGNKSEMAMGYTTLYGDMAGGFNALKDVPKTLVYTLSRYCNRDAEVIPVRIIERPPSAELRPDQTDQDSLPPYEVLDGILERYVEKDDSVADIVAAGYDEPIVRRVIWLLDTNEYKRRQAAPGVKITPRAFGKDRRYPITSGYSELDN